MEEIILEVSVSNVPASVHQSGSHTDAKDDVDVDAGILVENDESGCPIGTDAMDTGEADAAVETDALKSHCQEKVRRSAEEVSFHKQSGQSGSGVCWRTFTKPILVLVNAWRTYARQRVVFASVSLSLLYMTVLGFDSITIG